jgi:hypothetical protein
MELFLSKTVKECRIPACTMIESCFFYHSPFLLQCSISATAYTCRSPKRSMQFDLVRLGWMHDGDSFPETLERDIAETWIKDGIL